MNTKQDIIDLAPTTPQNDLEKEMRALVSKWRSFLKEKRPRSFWEDNNQLLDEFVQGEKNGIRVCIDMLEEKLRERPKPSKTAMTPSPMNSHLTPTRRHYFARIPGTGWFFRSPTWLYNRWPWAGVVVIGDAPRRFARMEEFPP